MTRHELIAIMQGAGPSAAPPGCRLAAAADYVAVLVPAPRLPPMKRADVAKAAADRARVLEALLPHGPVIPALSGQRLEEREAAAFVAANRPLLDALAERLGDRVQFQVTVRWMAERAAAAFGGQDLPALAAGLRARIADRITATGAETVALPIAGDVLSNTAVLIAPAEEPALDAAVEDIDAIWTEGFAIRVIGPFPAVSFASLAIERIDRGVIEDAQAAFGLLPGFTGEELKAARRRILMGAEPGRLGALGRQADILACAARLGPARGPVHVARVWSEDMSTAAGGTARAA